RLSPSPCKPALTLRARRTPGCGVSTQPLPVPISRNHLRRLEMTLFPKHLYAACILAGGVAGTGYTTTAQADDASDAKQEIALLKRQVSELTKKIDELSLKQEQTSKQQAVVAAQV